MHNHNNIQRAQSQILYNQSPILLFVTILLMILVLWNYWTKVDQCLLIMWASLVSIQTMGRIWLVINFKKRSEQRTPTYWLNMFTFTSFLSGMLWGVALLYILQPSLDSDILVLDFILTGMAAGSLVPLSTYLPNYYAFSIPTLFPSGLYFLNQQGTEYTITGSLVIVYLLALMGLSVFVNRNVLDTIRLRFENTDLLEETKIQRELAEKENRNKSRFLAATSHDLRQPLHALDLYLGALQIQLSEKNHLELINKASASSEALGDLLNALMDISRLDSGGVNINKSYFSLTILLASICNEFDEQAKEKNIVIEFKLDEIVVHTDPILLGLMLRNLISNAINHNENCDLSIATSESDGYASIDIRDNGQGIAASELNNIFSEFYQLNNPERDRTKGLGLGLAIVKRLSTLLNIPVDVASDIGKGTLFSLSIAIENYEVMELNNTEIEHSVELSGLFIIILDDEESVRDAIKSLLRIWECEVLSVSSEDELMKTLEQDPYPSPDLIISDYRLRDDKIGVDAVRAVRDYFKLDIPALIITGDSSHSLVAEITREHCQLLLKPVNSKTLKSEIAKVLET